MPDAVAHPISLNANGATVAENAMDAAANIGVMLAALGVEMQWGSRV